MSRRKHRENRAADEPEPASAPGGPAVSPSRQEQQDELAEWLTALVLGGIALLRPWQDGMTFPSVNNYYLWAQAALFALVGARMLVRRERLRFPLLVWLFAAFLAVAVLTTLDTVQYNNSYRTLLVWAGHFFLFVVASQTLRRPRSFAIVLSGFVAGAFAEAAFSVMHLKYYLPLVRERVQTDPSLVQRYFSAGELNPEIARRLKLQTETPVLVGVGISTPDQAVQTCAVADGVIVGSAVVRAMIEQGTPEAIGKLVADFRNALDAA